MKMFDIKEVASALGFGKQYFYTQFVSRGIVQPTGRYGIKMYWDDAGVVQAGIAINEFQKAKEEKREGIRRARLQQAERLAEKYRTGLTLEEIGAQEGVTRERVRQIMQPLSINRTDGGQSIRTKSISAIRGAAQVSRRESRCLKIYGCTFAEFQTVAGARGLSRFKQNRLLSLYWHHRTTAQRATTPWLFSLPQYAAFISGREHLFKRERDGLVLGRKDKQGPFSPENCEVITLAMNSAWTGGFKKSREHRQLQVQKVAELYAQGRTLGTIADELRCSKQKVQQLLNLSRKQQSAALA